MIKFICKLVRLRQWYSSNNFKNVQFTGNICNLVANFTQKVMFNSRGGINFDEADAVLNDNSQDAEVLLTPPVTYKVDFNVDKDNT